MSSSFSSMLPINRKQNQPVRFVNILSAVRDHWVSFGVSKEGQVLKYQFSLRGKEGDVGSKTTWHR